MQISKSDWLHIGPGMLYCHPFVSQHLLFRLLEEDCALLIGHTTTVAYTAHSDNERMVHWGVSAKNPKSVSIRMSTSAKDTLEEVLRLKPIELTLGASGISTEHKIREVTVRIESDQLEGRFMWATAPSEAQITDLKVVDSDFKIFGPMRAKKVPYHTSKRIEFKCYRAQVLNKLGQSYTISSEKSWSLEAYYLSANGATRPGLRLVRKP
jgi:hypothetical protein